MLNPQVWEFYVKRYNIFNETILHLPLFNGSDFNYTFEQKSQNVRLIGQK